MASQQTYINEFNPKEYLDTYYTSEDGFLFGEWTDFVFKNLHEAFTKGGIRGETLLDVGSGPTIYQLLFACEVFDKIIVSDLLEKNLDEIQKWLKKDPCAFDWNPMIKHACELEGKRENYEKKAEKLRSKVKEAKKCDVLKTNPYDPDVVPPVDCLMSCLCLETACKDIKTFSNVLKNMMDLIKPGGYSLILSGLDSNFYKVGKTNFPTLAITKEELETCFKEAGFQIEKAVYSPRADKSRMDITDYDINYLILARKPE